MKTFLLIGAFIITTFSSLFAQEVVRPNVAIAFGKPISIKGEFVAKPNDYHSQNIVSEPYSLKVTEISGKALSNAIIIEYKLELEKHDRTKVERTGVILDFDAYESLYQPPGATPWLGEFEQGTGFALIHVLHIRPKGPPSH